MCASATPRADRGVFPGVPSPAAGQLSLLDFQNAGQPGVVCDTLLKFIRSPLPISFSYVKDQLGHSSIKMTVDTYGHLVPGANRAAMDRLPTMEDLPEEESKRLTK